MQDIPSDTVIAASGGDLAAFEKIYRAASDYVYTVALKINGNRADAEEVTQDVFLKIYRNLNRFRFKSSFKTWLYRITVNTAINSAKRSAKRLSRQVEYNDGVKLKNASDTKQEAADKEQNEVLVRSMLKILNPDQRACIVLKEIEGLRYKEIAEVLKININTVRSRLKRARETLLAHNLKGSDRK